MPARRAFPHLVSARSLDTPGVIRRVSELFKGYPKLILGFNTFLPPGYKIEVLDENGVEIPASQIREGERPYPKPAEVKPLIPARPGIVPAPAPAAAAAAAGPPVRGPAPPVRTGPGAGPLEFDHAITYVTKIKKRFAADPGTYKQFLEILHAYQKQYRSIRDVLERVSLLFADHPDLLRDFTYFLPDSVQDQARERIARTIEAARQKKEAAAAAAEEERKRKEEAAAAAARQQPYGAGGRVDLPGRAMPPAMAKDRDRMREADRQDASEYAERGMEDREMSQRQRESDRERERMLDRARDRAQVGMGPGKSPRMQVVVKKRRDADRDMHLTLTPTERGFFERVKAAVGSRDGWVEFLKILELYSSEVLTRTELFTLVSDILPSGPGHKAMMEELKSMVASRGFTDMTPADIWYSMPIGEVDFTSCQRCTPSYRHLPQGYPRLACSERSRLEQEHLNDAWVSVPTGSEDFSFKIMRKNQYEDSLFRCEDDRHEVDQCIEHNASTIRVLEPLAEEISALKEHTKSTEWQFRLDRRSLGVLHLKAIARVYGEHGHEILELLRKNPAGAIPIILTRLRSKDEEWKRARIELNKAWKRVHEENYYKSLDHRSFYFKQADKKAILPRNLWAEIKGKVRRRDDDDDAVAGLHVLAVGVMI